jgi:dihydrofolate reductase
LTPAFRTDNLVREQMANERRVRYGVGVSLDGYIARPDGGVDWMWMDPAYDMGAFFKDIDTVILGRRSYDQMVAMSGGAHGGYEGLVNIVYSRTEPAGDRNGVSYTSEDPRKLVARLKSTPGKDIWLGGGGDLARSFLAAGAVDRIDLGVLPILIGSGIPAFPQGFPELKLTLREVKSYPTGMMTMSFACPAS